MMYHPQLVHKLAQAQRVAVLTGAGVSAESGIPTFRDPGGIWEKFRPEDLASVDAFIKNPQLVQAWYAHRRKIVQEVQPNPAHYALAELEQLIPDFTLITQNVDRLHQRAGSKHVIELHGNILRNYCIECGRKATEEELSGVEEGLPLRCTVCGELIRPDVVWFGEMLPPEALAAARTAAEQAQVFLSIGTSGVVYPAAELPVLAKEHGAYVVEINLQPSALAPYMDEVITGKAGEILPQLVAAVHRIRASNEA